MVLFFFHLRGFKLSLNTVFRYVMAGCFKGRGNYFILVGQKSAL